MKVKTLIGNDFIKACKFLSDKVANDFYPDIIIGVLTGGGYVGREVSNNLKTVSKHIYTEIRIQRKDTKKKEQGILHKVLQMLPYFMLNWLRIAEMLYEGAKAKKFNPKREGKVIFPDEVNACLQTGNCRVLVVDDAIDTGATLKLINDTIKEKYPSTDVRIAVVTVTSNHPLIEADYCLFHDKTLVRFPWSNDVKQKNEKDSCN